MLRSLAPLFLLGPSLLFADVTLRYSFDLKTAIALPGGAASPTPQMLPTVVQIKGDKTRSTMGKLTTIQDIATGQVTYIDADHMRYASGSVEDLARATARTVSNVVQGIPPAQAPNLANMLNADVQSRKTGRAETIHGFPAEEWEAVLSLNMNLPNLPANGPFARIVMQIWKTDADAVAQDPGLAEFARQNTVARSFLGDFSGMFRTLAPLPGMDQVLQNFQSATENLLSEPGMQVRMHMEESFVMYAALARQGRGQGQPPATGFDPSAPMMSMTRELVEVSTAPIDDSLFQIPSGFQKVELEEILKDSLPATKPR